jgi:hypothetical protein
MSGGDSAAARVCCRSGSYPASSSLLPARATADRVTNPSLVRGRASRAVACISPVNLAHPQGDDEPVVSGPQRWVWPVDQSLRMRNRLQLVSPPVTRPLTR